MNPRRIIYTLLTTAALALPSMASADTSDPTNYTPPAPAEAPTAHDAIPQKLALHLEPIAFVPVGSLGDVTGIGAGVMGGIEIRLSPSVSVTGRAG